MESSLDDGWRITVDNRVPGTKEECEASTARVQRGT